MRKTLGSLRRLTVSFRAWKIHRSPVTATLAHNIVQEKRGVSAQHDYRPWPRSVKAIELFFFTVQFGRTLKNWEHVSNSSSVLFGLIYIPLFEWSEVYHVRRLDQSRARQTNTWRIREIDNQSVNTTYKPYSRVTLNLYLTQQLNH